MARLKKSDADVLALEAQEKEALQLIEEIRRKKQVALDKIADQGRAPLLAALEKVKIGAMDRAQAKRLAELIGSTEIGELLAQLDRPAA
jgi:hypothetical protein